MSLKQHSTKHQALSTKKRIKLRFWFLLSACCLALNTYGCASIAMKPFSGPEPLPDKLKVYYDYPAHEHQAVSTLLERGRSFDVYLVRFPLSAPAQLRATEPVVEFEWFQSHQETRRPAILFNPILGGDYPIERNFCRTLARQGFHVALVHRKTLKIAPEEPVSHLEVLLHQGILRIRQITDWMADSDQVDASRMASFGISMGGIASVMTAAVEPRLRTHVVALAGGPIADILAGSHDKLLVKPRSVYLARNHMDIQTLAAQMRESIKTDPILLAPYVDSRTMLMYIAVLDRTIGTAHALKLWRALNRPQAVFMPAGHYTAYLALPYLKHSSIRFLRQRLR